MKITRRAALQGLAGAFVIPSAVQAATSALRTLAARKYLLYGCAASTAQLKDTDFAAVLVREAGILVTEYEMKRNFVERKRGQLDFTVSDRLMAFANVHGMAMRGHTLCWHRSNPAWLEEAVTTTRDPRLLMDYIKNLVGHYKGRMHSWDVVNEAIEPDDGRLDGLRNSFWPRALGPSYIDIAFHAAREADPKALLVHNDYGLETDLPESDRRRATTLKFLEAARARRVPIDALGLQGHLRAYGAKVNQKKLAAFLDNIKSLGLRILVTEHDISDEGGPSNIAARDQAVADASRRFLDVVFANSATIAVLTWGLSDRYGERGRRALPLDNGLRPKPMYQAIARALA